MNEGEANTYYTSLFSLQFDIMEKKHPVFHITMQMTIIDVENQMQ